MNRSFTKQRKIQEANMLLENRFLIKESRVERDKDSNRWYTAQDPTSKKWKIFVEVFSNKEIKDPVKTPNDPLFKDYTKYWVEYSTEALNQEKNQNLMWRQQLKHLHKLQQMCLRLLLNQRNLNQLQIVQVKLIRILQVF